VTLDVVKCWLGGDEEAQSELKQALQEAVEWLGPPAEWHCVRCGRQLEDFGGALDGLRAHSAKCRGMQMVQEQGADGEWSQHGVAIVKQLMLRQGISKHRELLFAVGPEVSDADLSTVSHWLRRKPLEKTICEGMAETLWTWVVGVARQMLHAALKGTPSQPASTTRSELASKIGVTMEELILILDNDKAAPCMMKGYIKRVSTALGPVPATTCPHCAKMVTEFETSSSVGLDELRVHIQKCATAVIKPKRAAPPAVNPEGPRTPKEGLYVQGERRCGKQSARGECLRRWGTCPYHPLDADAQQEADRGNRHQAKQGKSAEVLAEAKEEVKKEVKKERDAQPSAIEAIEAVDPSATLAMQEAFLYEDKRRRSAPVERYVPDEESLWEKLPPELMAEMKEEVPVAPLVPEDPLSNVVKTKSKKRKPTGAAPVPGASARKQQREGARDVDSN